MHHSKFTRRNFLRAGTLTAFGSVLATKSSLGQKTTIYDDSEIPKIKEYRKFGKTGFEVSDISSGNPSNEAVLKALLKSGVNLIDTGEAYGNGNSERLIGEVIKDFDRSSIFINSKLYTEKAFPSKQEVIDRTNQCLERLQTDYVDCMQIHSAENTAILKDEAFHSAMEQLKKEGKVRHLGVSCHGSNWAYNTEESLDKIMLAAIEDGRFDVLLLAYNFMNAEIGEKVLEACDKNNIATLIMKSNPVYIYGLMEGRVNKLNEQEEEIDEYTQAFFDKYKIMNDHAREFFKDFGVTEEKELMEAASKYVLSNNSAHSTLWDFSNFDEVTRMLKLSGQKISKQEKLALNTYKQHMGQFACRIGCNACHSACPEKIPVNKILRYNYYFTAKRQEKRAIAKFAQLKSKKPAEVCSTCEGFCEKACPFGVSTRSLLAMAQNNMEILT
ncbi:MAG: aldo/keto reductase [Bacteroidales bacterium]|nr:aldo/keto reductase [Bacteroidales bacterium]MBN2818715.1 aldo/keto reductase [Bacteroidales bacterium]